MGRSSLATSLKHFKSYLHYVSVPLPKPKILDNSCRGYVTSVLPGHSLQSTPFSKDDWRSFRGFSQPEERSHSKLWMSQGLRMSTIHLFDRQRSARSSSFMMPTSGRSRACYYEQRCGHTSGQDFEGKPKISVTFVDKDGEETNIKVPVGMSMLEAAHENDIDLEGACEGSLACSTCHVIVMEEDMYARLPEPTDEENDMLDLAFGLTETSRLGCQVIAQPELDGLRLALPAATRNFAVDGHVPKPH